MNPRAVDMALQMMDSRAFEDLVFALVRLDEPTARQLTPPDAGRDTVVPATKESRERAWQAKRHASIDWSDCEESLDRAVAERDPEEVTFVFPVNMTEGKEVGLEILRNKYPADKVRLPEPWTLGTLRELLLANPEVRRSHIDSVLGFDHEFVRELLERGAEFKERWSEQVDAALRGPLSALGQEEAAAEADQAVREGDWAGAAERFERIGDVLANRMPAVADVMILRAARCAGEAGDRSRAADLHLRVSRSAARRGDSVAEYAAFRASWQLSEADRWRSLAAMARSAWPESPEESIVALREAFDRCMSAGDLEGVGEWGDACCEALAAREDWDAVRQIGEQALAALGPLEEPGSRLEIELDLLDARGAAGASVDADFAQLLLSPVARDDATGARIRARWGCVLVRAERGADAALRFQEAASGWLATGAAEEEIGEAVLSQDSASKALGEGPQLDQPDLIAVADLRSRDLTAAALADRKETEGMRCWLMGRGPDARRSMTVSWSVHRRAGHFSGCARVAETLSTFFERTNSWPEVLNWAIRAGRGQKAREAAEHLSWAEVFSRVHRPGPVWERAASFEAIAVRGVEATDDQVRDLTGPLMSLASSRGEGEASGLQAGPAARRALSAVLCRIPSESFDLALEHVRYELETTPFPPRDATQGLLLATDAGLCDATELIAEAFCAYHRAHVPGFPAALSLIASSESAQAIVRERARDTLDALVLAAHLRLPDEDEALRQRVADFIKRSVEGSSSPDEFLRLDDRGHLARWASTEDQAIVAHELVHALADPGDHDVHRHEAGAGLLALAAALDPEAASAVFDELHSLADRIAQPAQLTELQSDPNPHFARVKISTPRATDHVRAIALSAACELAARCERLDEVVSEVAAGLTAADGVVRASAVRVAHRWPDLVEADFAHLIEDDDPEVAGVALAAAAADGSLPESNRLAAFCEPDQPLALRCSVLGIAREDLDTHLARLEQLADDPHVYVRAIARRALGQR